MADERQILVASLREHFEGIVEATDLFLQNLSGDTASREELEAARGANSVLKSECSDWRKQALDTHKRLKDLKRRYTELERRSADLQQLCTVAVDSLKECAPELYAKHHAELVDLVGSNEHASSATPVATTATEPATEAASESAAVTATEPAAEATGESAAVTATKPTAEATVESAAATATEPTAEAAVESVAATATEPTAEAAVESVAATATEPAAEATVESAIATKPVAVESAAVVNKPMKHADPKAALRELVKVSMSAGRGLKGIKGANGNRKVKKAAARNAAEAPTAQDSASSSDEASDKPDPAAAGAKLVQSCELTIDETTSEIAENGSEIAIESVAESVNEPSIELTAEEVVEPAAESVVSVASESEEAASVVETGAKLTSEVAAEPEEVPIVNNSKLKLPMFANSKLKDRLEVTLDETLADKLEAINNIIEQTEEAEKVPSLELLPQLGEEIHFTVSDDPQVVDEVKAGLKLSEAGEYDSALAKFARLFKQDSYILQPNLAILHNYINMARWEDAYKAGLPLLYDTFGTDCWENYAQDMSQAVINKMAAGCSDIELKKFLFILALTNAKYPVTARKFLCLADSIKEKCHEEAALHYYLLKVGVVSAKIDDTVESLKEITICPELFDELFEQAKNPVNRKHLPVLKMIEALYLDSKDGAKAIEDKTESLVPLGPVQISPADVERYHSKETSGKVIDFMFNQLFPKADFEPSVWPERFNVVLEDSKLIPFNFKPAEIFERLNARIFKFANAELRYYDGKEQFFVKAFSSDKGKTFILHAKMADLTPAEQQFVLLRKCFQLYHHHTQLWYARISLDDTMMCKLLSTVVGMCVEDGIEAASPWLKVVSNYDADTSNLYRRILETITRLYKTTEYEPFLILKEFLFAKRPFTAILDGDANRFAAKAVGMTEASYGLARLFARLRSDYDILAQEGFCALYADLQAKDELLRRSLQLLWTSYLQDDNYI